MFKPIKWTKNSFLVDGSPEHLISGDIHYFRVPKQDWEERLTLFKCAGGICASTLIPWALHEPAEGDFRFGGEPSLELEDYLRLCAGLGLYVVCRPGPYVYTEMYYGGLPKWLIDGYPEIQAQRADGSRISKLGVSVSYTHPVFLEKAERYLSEVCGILRLYTVERGGPVALVQLDNELIGFHEWNGAFDHNRENMGIGIPGGKYPRFLLERYSDIGALNAAYGEQNRAFEEVLPFVGQPPESYEEKRKAKDYQDFYFSDCAEYLARLADIYRKNGVCVRFTHNSASPYMNAFFLEATRGLGEEFMLGADHSYNLDSRWDQNNPTPQYAVKTFCSLEMLRLMGYPPAVFELPGGSTSDWPPILPEDLKCCYMLGTAFGMKGFTYYVFTGGPGNPRELSYRGNYDYGAAVSAEGVIRPHYYVQRDFHAFLREHAWLAEASMESDLYIGLDWEHPRGKHYDPPAQTDRFSGSDAWKLLQDGVIVSAMCGGLTPSFVDLAADGLSGMIDKPLLVVCSENMSERIQKNLIVFVKAGGRLALLPTIPVMDEIYNACTLLRDFLGHTGDRFETPAYNSVSQIGSIHVRDYKCRSCDALPDRAQAYSRRSDIGRVTGWRRDFEGGGRAVWLGYIWFHQYFEHTEILRELYGRLSEEPPAIRSDNPNVWAVIRSSGGKRLMFLMNLFSSPQRVSVETLTVGAYGPPSEVWLGAMEVKTLELD